ncbi:MAG: aminoacyl-tRNA hydrolase [Chitinophagaceae bacterium]|nr:aminoacyl-tRNA hydrolase [Chitinophagaceae bacterium]
MKFLIAGLGNIGDEYMETRHNIGFKIVEALAEEAGASFISERFAAHASYRFKGKSIHLIKPSTYMNLSGKAVKYWMDKLEIEKQQLIVIVDDLAIPFGELRIRSKGSDGGHNGLTSVQELLQSIEYPRMRFGIEGNFPKGKQVNYVLGKWTPEEQKLLPEKIRIATDAVKSFATIGLERTMNFYNKAGKQGDKSG